MKKFFQSKVHLLELCVFGCIWFSAGWFAHAQEPQSNPGHALVGAERHWEHFEYLVRLKNDVAKAYWPDFARKDLHSPVLYYSLKGTFVINPNPHILRLTGATLIESPNPEWAIYKLPQAYTDTTEFQFSNSYSDEPTSLFYGENIMVFSSFQLTQKFVPITDLQDWAVMVLHELFHSYQRSFPSYRKYYQNLTIPGGPDSFLGAYHKDLPWFRQQVQRENQLLKELWHGEAPPSKGIRRYQELRRQRRERIRREYEVDIADVEDYEIMMEGHARYFQSLAKRYMRDNPTDTSMLSMADRDLIGNIFDGYDPLKDKGLSDIYNDRYYYQLGYNISMILEKYLSGYVETIYQTVFNFNPYLKSLEGEGPVGNKK